MMDSETLKKLFQHERETPGMIALYQWERHLIDPIWVEGRDYIMISDKVPALSERTSRIDAALRSTKTEGDAPQSMGD